MKKGFTLAEIMIVLVIIGVLTGILMPIAIHSAPDKNVMKFKKADTTLKNAIRELVNSGDYYMDGDLGIKKDGTKVDSATYFCETLADVLNTKSVKCSTIKNYSYSHYHILNSKAEVDSGQKLYSGLDNVCKLAAASVGAEIKTVDNIVVYQTSPADHFQTKMPEGDGTKLLFYYRPCSEVSCDGFGTFLKDGITTYKAICIDIDGIPSDGSSKCDDIKDICPFGYGIRVDGKILNGARAEEWLEKDFQKGKNE